MPPDKVSNVSPKLGVWLTNPLALLPGDDNITRINLSRASARHPDLKTSMSCVPAYLEHCSHDSDTMSRSNPGPQNDVLVGIQSVAAPLLCPLALFYDGRLATLYRGGNFVKYVCMFMLKTNAASDRGILRK